MTKISILMIAVVAIGIFALPASMSIGAGQHKFRQYDSANTTAAQFCGQCHGDNVQAELDASDARSANNALLGYAGVGVRVHGTIGCQSCHAITEGYMKAGGKTNATSQHAALLPSCLNCHGAGNTWGFNNVAAELSNTTEAHKFFNSTTDDDIQCIGCHTYVNKSGTISYTTSGGVTAKGLLIGG
ncbi:MAG TPA: hypothetical protein VN316_02630 [candidate division Zixibacteria bacterium]|nr:hypothetical protein [candidate division Zixibacteria bacterium]